MKTYVPDLLDREDTTPEAMYELFEQHAWATNCPSSRRRRSASTHLAPPMVLVHGEIVARDEVIIAGKIDLAAALSITQS